MFADWEGEHGCIRARLRMLATTEGGRSVFTGYRASWGVGRRTTRGSLNDGPISIEGRETLNPGDEGIVRVHPALPEFWTGVAVGTPLAMQEGSRLVGVAEVIELVPPTV